MSFAKRLRSQRRTGGLLVAALAASVGMGTAVAQAPVVTQSSTQAPREFVHTEPRKAKKPTTAVNRVKPKNHGHGWDSRKARRRIIMFMARKENSGRQWKKIRRALRRGENAAIMTTPAWKLAIIAHTTRILLSKHAA